MATRFTILYGWAFHITIRAEDAAVTRFRFEQDIALLAFIKPLAGMGGHLLDLFKITMGACNGALQYYFSHHLLNGIYAHKKSAEALGNISIMNA